MSGKKSEAKKPTTRSRKKSNNQVSDENVCPINERKRKVDENTLVKILDNEELTDHACPASEKKRKTKQSNADATVLKDNISYKSNSRKKQSVYLSCNILQYCRQNEMGLSCQKYRKPLKDSIINYCKTFELYKMESPFDRRVTYLSWHPTNPNLLAVASHGGDVLLYNYEQDISCSSMIEGIGAGGSVQNMKFDPLNPIRLYTASMEGKFLVLNFETKEQKNFLETNDLNRWYVSLDVNSSNNIMVAGDTRGGMAILNLNGDVIDTVQVHKKGFKVSHTEFSKREPWLLCTSSTDKTIKLWDIRCLKQTVKGASDPLQVIDQLRPINAAYFSLTDGCRLLTTDQTDKIHIYRAPFWNLETTISHPHRQFQHLTPIRAYWHPLEDIVFVGRYPCEKFPGYQPNELRTIDFFDAETGHLLYQHYQSGINGILSLNRFNITGDALASSFGQRFLIWKPNFKRLDRQSKKEDLYERKRRKNILGDDDDGNDKNDNSDDPDDNDDDDDGNDGSNRTSSVDWKAVMKKQTQEKKQSKGKKKS